jgi:hypothetical protein
MGEEDYPCFELIQHVSGIDGLCFNPTPLIRAVNELLRFERTRIRTILRRHVQLAREASAGDHLESDDQRLFLIERLLFQPAGDETALPPILIGVPDVSPGQDTESWPIFPLALVDEIPFLVVGGYNLAGLPQSPLEYLEVCLDRCKQREVALAPQASPIDAVEKLLNSYRWRRLIPTASTGWYAGLLYRQALRALEPLYVVAPGDLDALYRPSKEERERIWTKHAAEVRELRPSWSAAKQQYVAQS